MTSVEAKCNLQKSRLNLIEQAFEPFNDKDPSEVCKVELGTRLDVLEANWLKFDKDNDRICDSKLEILNELPYITKDWYSVAQEAYIVNKAKMLKLLSKITVNDHHNTSNQSNDISTNSSGLKQQPILPKINLPSFSGDYQSWKSFSDLFTSLIIENFDLAPVAKMHYLKNCLTKEAAHIVSNLQVSGENFNVAWEKLKTRFENKRVLINKHLDDVFKLKPVNKKSSKNLSTLISVVNESLGCLKSLGSPTEYWDDIMVYIIVNRLDAETHEAWELHQGSSVNSPTLQELQRFIDGRVRALEGIELRELTRPPTSSFKPQGNSSSFQKNKVHTSQVVDLPKPQVSCKLCNESHYLSNCNIFAQKSALQRKEYIISQKLCFNCLGPHMLRECRSKKSCQVCRKRHHTLIHDSANQSVNTSTALHLTESLSQSDIKKVQLSSDQQVATTNHALPESKISNPKQQNVLLATAQVNVIGPHQTVVTAKALIDQGSEISFISEHLVQTLHLNRTSSLVSLQGVGGNQSATARGKTSVTLSSIYDKEVNLSLNAYILPKLTSFLPSKYLSNSVWPHIKHITLADPTFMNPASIDLILGADIYGEIILSDLIKGPHLTPIAQSTVFGWILSGPVEDTSFHQSNLLSTHHCVSNSKTDRMLERFWIQEEIPNIKELEANKNSDCEDFFKSSYKRMSNGRYQVSLPLKESPDVLGDSHASAVKMLQSIQPRISAKSDYGKLYSDFIQEYESLDHMSVVPPDQLQTKPVYYLPHHGVLKSTSSSTKLRVVFNASHPTSSGKSLNDILHSGPKLQTDLPDVLLWFRSFKYVFVTDIEKMYRQILVNPNDWNLQRILWLKNGQLLTYQLKTVTYGLSCAPFLALRTLDQLIIDEGGKYPQAVDTLKKGRYVDDIFGGDETVENCVELVSQVDQICKSACFPLKKWISNHPLVLKDIEIERQENKNSLNLDNAFVIKTLGLSWETSTDNFQFLPKITPITEVTKRNVLSRIAQFFDPLGFIAPVIIKAKIFIQQLWLVKLNWDDTLPDHLAKDWRKFEVDLNDLTLLQVPRFLNTFSSSTIEIHGFSDASSYAMSAVVYLKVINSESTSINFVCAKTKVAPLKKMTIPRLELTAATLLAKLVNYVRRTLNLFAYDVWLWIDSSVALTWITNSPSKWKEFVSNRVNYIQEQIPSAHWRFVPGMENPADCASRGLSPKSLSDHPLWWQGPSWLINDSSSWPKCDFTPNSVAFSEERRHKSVHTNQKVTEPDLLLRYSSFKKLLRITAWCLKFKGVTTKTDSHLYLAPIDINQALQRWIKIVQQLAFQREINLLQAGQTVDKSSTLKSLNPFIDKHGLVRVGGRLSQSQLDYDTKHPYILPKDSTFSKLIIQDMHLQTLHGSTRDTLATTRQQFWILGGRPTIKKELLKCVVCARHRAQRAQQLMGQLPPNRTTPSRPFLHSGVDYAGPFVIKTWKGKRAKTYKGYIVVFICSSTSAVHLELVTDYSSETFIAAYKRFSGRRGICATLTSDCGTTFVGADTELKRLFSTASTELGQIRHLLAKDGTEWKFNPAGAPHFGGRWEAGVKCVKYHLKRVMGNTVLTYEEFSTVLAQTEAILNSRPLCPLTEDPDDLSTLTPAHFLVGEPLTTVPEPNIQDVPTSRISRWKLTRQIIESFWKKWSKEYLQQLQAIYKWRFPSNEVKVGSIVLIIDENLPPSKWSLAKVIETHPGRDGLTRVVTLKTARTTLKRPIVKLCPLPTEN